MKIQQLSFLCTLIACCLLSTYNVKSRDNQHHTYTIYTNKELESLYAPIIFSSSGIKQFFAGTFNRVEYAQEILPNDFSHFIQWLERSVKTLKCKAAHSSLQQAEIRQALKKARAHAKGVIRVFKNKIHSCPYINAYAFDNMLVEVLELLDPIMHKVLYKDIDDPVHNAYELLYLSFSENFAFFKRQPRTFLMDLSRSLIDQLNEYYTPDASLEELRSMFIRFLEISLGKLVWHPQDGFKTWESVKSLADHLADLVEHEIIEDVEDLNDLYISLLERYIFFLDISGDQLPLAFYTRVKEDVANNSTILLELEEQEEFIEPKMQRFVNVLNIGEAKALARELVPQISE